MVREHEKLLKIAKKIQRNNKLTKFFRLNNSKKIIKDLEKVNKEIYIKLLSHQDKFSWMNIYCWLGEPFALPDYIKRIKNLLKFDCQNELLKLKKEREIREKRSQELIEKLKIGKDTLMLIITIRDYAYLKAYRFDVYSISQYNVRNLIAEIADRNNISSLDVIYSTPQEIVNWLENKTQPNISLIKEREKEYAIIKLGGREIIIYSGRELAKFKRSFKVKDYSRLKEIKGNVTFPGKVIGKVKIVLDGSMIKKINKGDILVAPMTNPDYTPVIPKVSAIITDQGGLLCHAAIIAREFNIPCIIGTKIATQVLKDGDQVEVDAENGVVRILK